MSAAAKTHGQVAYEAYADHCLGKSIHGEELPDWDDQKPEIRDHWEAAAWAVAQADGSAYAKTVIVLDHHGRPQEFKADDWTRNSDGSLTVLRAGRAGEDEARAATFAPGWLAVYHGAAGAG